MFVSTRAPRDGERRAGAGVLAIALLALAVGCGDDATAAPGSVADPIGTPGRRDGGTAGHTDPGRGDGGGGGDRAFGFDEFAVDHDDAPAASAGTSSQPDGGVVVPEGWRCRPAFGGDAVCDCGCGAPDGACATQGCAAAGCALPVCEACWTENGEPRDCAAPGAWTCERARRGDGVCDCGCGALDPDCAPGAGCHVYGCNVAGCELCHGDGGSAACGTPAPFRCPDAARSNGRCDCGCGNYDPECVESSCPMPGCQAGGCDVCHDASGAIAKCETPDLAWHCAQAARGDGVCDCGCGESDPDCAQAGCDEPGCAQAGCELCHDRFGRELPCPGSWTCAAARYGDGVVCDCGCGRADPDCDGGGCSGGGCAADACDVRWQDGVAIAPAAWSCDATAFGGGDGCNCGCGALDPDCDAGGCAEPGCRAEGCANCRAADGSAFECRWQCELARFGSDGACDCGCGALDPDCAAGLGCSAGGCYADGCAHCFDSDGAEYECARGACRAGFQTDGVCDCGCREDDPDCAGVRDCVEPGCSAEGCGRCHDADGEQLRCEHWTCDFEQQGGGDRCNCGCGAPDPDCAAGEGCAAPGCRMQGCATCRTFDGAPMSCAP